MRTLLAVPALVAMLCAAPVAEATLASNFNNANLDPSTQLANIDEDSYPTGFLGYPGAFLSAVGSQGLSTFTVVASGSNSIPVGDSISFTSSGNKYFRGTNDPGNIPNLVTLLSTWTPTTHTITFNSPNPITEITLSVAGLRDTRTLEFTGGTAGDPSSASGNLFLSSADTASALSGSNPSSIGHITWTFLTPVSNPTIDFQFNSGFNTQVHLSGISYAVAAIPEPASFVWFASAFGLVQYGRRRRVDATLAD